MPEAAGTHRRPSEEHIDARVSVAHGRPDLLCIVFPRGHPVLFLIVGFRDARRLSLGVLLGLRPASLSDLDGPFPRADPKSPNVQRTDKGHPSTVNSWFII